MTYAFYSTFSAFSPLSKTQLFYFFTNKLSISTKFEKKSGVPEGHTALACLNSEKSLSVSVRK